MNSLCLPDKLHLITETSLTPLEVKEQTGREDVVVELDLSEEFLGVSLSAKATPVRGLHLRWKLKPAAEAIYLRSAWGRQDGDLRWQMMLPHEPMPWFFMTEVENRTDGLGVRTNGNALASWQLDADGLSLFLDTRNGGSGVVLGGRNIELVQIRSRRGREGESPFAAMQAFCRELATEVPRACDELFYGGNNWYYAYGKITHQSCLDDAKRMGDWCAGLPERPFMVIDDGWEVAHCDNRYNGGPWTRGNFMFPDLAKLAAEMKSAGSRPGIWYRPLLNLEGHMEPFMIRNGLKPSYAPGGYIMDPTFPEVDACLRSDAACIAGWGFELIKHDFTTVDLLGSWLNPVEPVTRPSTGWHFHDRSRTNAEIVKGIYEAIQEGAATARILGCQTFGHLGVGTIDVQRTGGDTDGRGWERTRRMGPNSLAFCQPHHGIFYQCDGDCAPITPLVPMNLAISWMDLLAYSGTPLFISADPQALNAKSEAAIREALRVAASRPTLAEPLDWIENPTPARWKCGDEIREYQWLPEIGCAPDGLVPGDPMRILAGL